ncbi:MAG: hypothetical protein ACRBDX_03040 [Gammaproteobacteria bacterium]
MAKNVQKCSKNAGLISKFRIDLRASNTSNLCKEFIVIIDVADKWLNGYVVFKNRQNNITKC